MATKTRPEKATSVKRTYFTIRFSERLNAWCVYVNGCVIAVGKDHAPRKLITKGAVVQALAARCDDMWERHQILSELRICNKDGQYQPARTYGKDPKRSIG